MDALTQLRIFVAVAEGEGFAPAARRLGVSPPAVTRAVAALERRIGARLFHRTTRVVRTTEAGARFLGDCRRILAELDEAEARAAGLHAEPRGRLAVTAPVMFGRLFVTAVILDFLAERRGIEIRASLSDRVVDLIEEGLDVAVRIAHLPDSTLAAVRVGSVRQVLCASPAFLATHGTPRHPSDLARFETVAFGTAERLPPWSFAAAEGELRVDLASRLVANTPDVAVVSALAGFGIARVLSYQVGAELRDGRLVRLLPDFEPPPIPIHVVHPEGRRASARVRAFVDFAVERLRSEPSLRS
ncbi:MAG TPA: LysR family transcriptional regulator [Myxococcota bacterium]|nr:LysR family transcriptional regulator [Myxococcota bacterium]